MSYEGAYELAKRDAEIERLKDNAKIQALQIDQLIEHEQKTLLPLIRELADALDEEHVSRPRLIKRAREL